MGGQERMTSSDEDSSPDLLLEEEKICVRDEVTRPSLFAYFCAQLSSKQLDAPQNTKHERVYNFLLVPGKLEQFLFFGYMVCFDAFLYNFTILPLRIVLAIFGLLVNTFCFVTRLKTRLPCSWSDLLKCLMVVLAGYGVQMVDSSRLYHSIRGQSTLKLYVIYNVLEVADKLCCSFGLDILDSFYSKQPAPVSGERPIQRLRPLPHFLLAIFYILLHTIVLFYQAITLNVAINSYSNALLTLLVSNQFVEIKSAVFKKFEKENLFQLSCADVVERFQLSLYLVIIGIRNLSEMRNSLDSQFVLERLLLPLAVVYISEIAVDWLKHAFITKFNHIHPDVYLKFCNILAKDFETVAEVESPLVDKSPQVSRRIGFSVFPLSCLLIRVVMQFDFEWGRFVPRLFGSYIALLIVKLIVGINLAAFCRKRTLGGINRSMTTMPSKKIFSSQSQIMMEETKRELNSETPFKPLKKTLSVDDIKTLQ